jgi:hypothetical protein
VPVLADEATLLWSRDLSRRSAADGVATDPANPGNDPDGADPDGADPDGGEGRRKRNLCFASEPSAGVPDSNTDFGANWERRLDANIPPTGNRMLINTIAQRNHFPVRSAIPGA